MLSALLVWIAHEGPWNDFSITENRPLERFEGTYWEDLKMGVKSLLLDGLSAAYELYFHRILDNSLQAQIGTAAVDQFPKRLKIIELGRAYERGLILGTYGFTHLPALPASLDTDYYVMRDAPVFILEPKKRGYINESIIKERAENYRQVIEQFPDLNFYIFYLERLDFSEANPLNPFFENLDLEESFEYFISEKPGELVVSVMELDNLKEHIELFFNTDHHWNIRGAWHAYEIIYDMLAEGYPNISPKLELSGFEVVKGVEFCGSFARRTLYPCTPEKFEYAEVTLPPYTTFVDGVEKEYGNRDAYLRGEFSRHKYANHYSDFFGNVVDAVEYRFDNGAERDLLIIGGSHSQAVQLYIAAHYRTTYVVDLRTFKEFSLAEAVDVYGIDDVLVLGDIIIYGWPGWTIGL